MSKSSPSWENAIDYAAESHVGMRRSNNQDALAVSIASSQEDWDQWGHLFLVADGMGAHAAGELASKIASDNIPHLYRKHPDLTSPEALRRAVIEANAEINRKGQANQEFHNMGTTCSVLALLPQGAVVAHVGDSRVYRIRKGKLQQLTFDHSLVWEMQAAGHIQPGSEPAVNLPRNVITRSLGPSPEVKVDLEGPFPTQVGDTFLLCSDGLVGEVADDEIGTILAHLEPREAARALVDLANFRGGSDNVTVVIAKVANEFATSNSNTWHAAPAPNRTKSKSVSPVSLFLGVVAAASLIAGLAMFLAGNPVVGAVAALIGAACGLVLAARMLGDSESAHQPSTRVLGKGPYSDTDCATTKVLVPKLKRILEEVQETAVEQNWKIDWDTFREIIERSDKAATAGRESKALQLLVRALTFSMDELRSQSRTR